MNILFSRIMINMQEASCTLEKYRATCKMNMPPKPEHWWRACNMTVKLESRCEFVTLVSTNPRLRLRLIQAG